MRGQAESVLRLKALASAAGVRLDAGQVRASPKAQV